METIAIGIDTPMTIVARTLRKNSNNTNNAKIPPKIIFWITELIDCLMNSDVSTTTSNSTSSGKSSFKSATASIILLDTSTEFPSDCFRMLKTTASSLFTNVVPFFLKVS